MFIDGEIVTDEYEDTDTSAAGFRDALKQLGDVKEINLHINSPGGSVFEGIAIYNMLKQSKAKINVYVDALAASIASVIAMSGDAIFMPSNSMLMIHNPYEMVIGNANQLRKAADDMDRLTDLSVQTYLNKAGDKIDEKTLRQLMDDETWLTANQAVDYGLADEVIGASQAVASLNSQFTKGFKNIPEKLLENVKQKVNEKQETVERESAWRDELKEKLNNFDENKLSSQLSNLQEELINGRKHL